MPFKWLETIHHSFIETSFNLVEREFNIDDGNDILKANGCW